MSKQGHREGYLKAGSFVPYVLDHFIVERETKFSSQEIVLWNLTTSIV